MPIDLTVALAHVDGDSQLLAELAAIFLEDYPRLNTELRHSIEQGKPRELERAAHTLKGRLAFFGMEKETNRALRLETMSRQNDLAEAQQVLADLEAEIESAMFEFDSLAKGRDA